MEVVPCFKHLDAAFREHSPCAGDTRLLDAMALVKFMKETWGKQSVWESLKAGGWRAAIDGTLA